MKNNGIERATVHEITKRIFATRYELLVILVMLGCNGDKTIQDARCNDLRQLIKVQPRSNYICSFLSLTSYSFCFIRLLCTLCTAWPGCMVGSNGKCKWHYHHYHHLQYISSSVMIVSFATFCTCMYAYSCIKVFGYYR